jgi:lipopolysaccharide heptosyltransferase III
MDAILDQLGKGAHVSILRLRSLGDCVLTTPAIHLLKRYRPDLRIAVVVEPRFVPLFEDNPDIDDLFPPYNIPLIRFSPLLVLNLHGGTRSAVLTLASRARHRAGFAHFRYRAAYNIRIPTAQQILHVDRKVHTVEHLASAMFYLGVPRQEIPPAMLYGPAPKPARPYAVIHPFASAPDKTWPAERFLELARHLRERCDLQPVFIGAASDDLTPFAAFSTLTPALSGTKSLLAGASLFIGNDSGPAHMAAAFHLPLVVLFAASDPIVWAPWKTPAETIVAPQGIGTVPAKRVIRAIERLRVKA